MRIAIIASILSLLIIVSGILYVGSIPSGIYEEKSFHSGTHSQDLAFNKIAKFRYLIKFSWGKAKDIDSFTFKEDLESERELKRLGLMSFKMVKQGDFDYIQVTRPFGPIRIRKYSDAVDWMLLERISSLP